MTTSDGTPAAVLRRYLEAIPDRDALAPLLHDDVTFQLFVPNGKVNRGRDRILGGLEREFQNFYRADAFDLRVHMVFGDDTFGGARFEITAETRRGPYRNDYSIFVRVEAGQIIEGWEYVDSANAAAQLT